MVSMDLTPAFSKNNVPVVFASDDKYVFYLSVVLASLKGHSDINSNYDIVVLSFNISEGNKTVLRLMFGSCPNFSLRFIEVEEFFKNHEFFIDRYLSLSTYSRLFIPEIFSKYQKVVYLDSDLVLNADVKELYDIDLKDKCLLACRDLGFVSGTIRKDKFFGDNYAVNQLHIDNYFEYFNAGVLVFNVEAIKKQGKDKVFFDKLRELKKPIFHDQDVLNASCYGSVAFIENMWNFSFYPDEEIRALSEDFKKLYKEAAENPKIVHFVGFEKPWHSFQKPFAFLWWCWARKSPFYELILKKNEASLSDIDFEKREYFVRLFGYVPFGRVTVQNNKIKYLIWKIPVFKLKRNKQSRQIFLFNIPCFKVILK